MGKKRKEHTSQSGHHSHDKKQRISSGTSALSSVGLVTSKPLSANPRQQNGNSVLASASRRGAAKAWLSRELKHLQELKNGPELQEELRSIAGVVYVESALAWSADLEATQAALKPEIPSTPAKDTFKSTQGDAESLPPCPDIMDAQLADQAFTHRSAVSGLDALHGNNSDYERLEFVGDSYMYPMCAQFVSELYPNATPANLNSCRQVLLNNESLAHFSQLYRFEEKIKINPNVLKSMEENAKSWTKLLGDIFEAYVAAVILSRPKDGWRVTETWLRTLWASFLPRKEVVHPSNKATRSELSQKVLSPGIKLYYEEIKPKAALRGGVTVFTMGVFLTGWGWEQMLLGEGAGGSKTAAGAAAAEAALRNPLTKKVSEVKNSFDQLRKQELEREGGPREDVLEALDKKWK